MSGEAETGTLTTDALLGGRLTFRQPHRGHRIGTDTVLLAALAAGLPGDDVLDLGAGVGGLGVTLAAMQPERKAVLVEREEELAALARENAVLNRVAERITVLAAEVETLRNGFVHSGAFDLVVCNPPFHDPRRHRASPDGLRHSAHLMPAPVLDAWIATAAWALRPKGALALIHRADALGALLALLEQRFGAIAVRPVHPRADEPAGRVLVSAVLGSGAALAILPGLVLHGTDGRFTPLAEALHCGNFEALSQKETGRHRGRPVKA